MNQAPHRALPIVSPFVAKLDVTLRHAKIPFAYAQVAMDKLPTGKMPTLHWNGTILSDSQLIVDALVKEGIMAQHPDAWMDPETRAVANMFRFSLETLPYGGLGIERWIDHWPSTRDLYFHKASWFFRYIFFPIVIRPKIVSNFKKTGILGYPMQARDDMIESFWEDASTLLGTKRYFFSENHMSTSDFAAFGFLFNFLAFKELTPKQSAAICKHQNLIQFVERVKKELYPEILTDAQAIESKKDK
ncbi:hypothetical protein BC830DRAFT_1062945 [Chytriomyces sp. MP71]|nr:hypothetical protein BC830DRAFT_1062945 [Chytriomyces sp. MP71]